MLRKNLSKFLPILLSLSSVAHAYSERDLEVLTEAVYYEARGEPTLGQLAVVQVIMNRVKSKRFPNSIPEVVYQPLQFSYNNSRSSYEDVLPMTNRVAYNHAKSLSKRFLEGSIEVVPVGDSDHYFNGDLTSPKWAAKMSYKVTIGKHSFFKEGLRR